MKMTMIATLLALMTLQTQFSAKASSVIEDASAGEFIKADRCISGAAYNFKPQKLAYHGDKPRKQRITALTGVGLIALAVMGGPVTGGTAVLWIVGTAVHEKLPINQGQMNAAKILGYADLQNTIHSDNEYLKGKFVRFEKSVNRKREKDGKRALTSDEIVAELNRMNVVGEACRGTKAVNIFSAGVNMKEAVQGLITRRKLVKHMREL